MAIKLRSATVTDLPAITAILNDAILTSTASWSYAAKTDAEMRDWFQMRNDMNIPILVAEGGDGTILGYATWGPFRNWPGYRFTAEHSVYVEKDARGQGVGKLLLENLVECARAAGLKTLIGGISAENEASLAFHRSLGFEETGRLPDIGYKFDRWLTLVFMQRRVGD